VKGKKAEEELNANAWMMTFTNLIILLLAFFIIMVTMSVRDERKKRLAWNSLTGSFGFKTGGLAVIGSRKGGDITINESPIMKQDLALTKLQNAAFSNGFGSDVKVTREAERIIIRFSNRVIFDRGSSTIPQKSTKFLAEMSAVLKDGPGLIELRGYADHADTVFDPDPSYKSMYLSTKRALAVLHFMKDKGKIPVDRLVAHGFGNLTAKSVMPGRKRAWEGQVEIIVDYHQEIPYRLRKPKPKNRSLDYRGFFFNLY
jgi:chemotaxis protein MotB